MESSRPADRLCSGRERLEHVPAGILARPSHGLREAVGGEPGAADHGDGPDIAGAVDFQTRAGWHGHVDLVPVVSDDDVRLRAWSEYRELDRLRDGRVVDDLGTHV